MSTSKPTFVLVAGAFCPGFYFHKVVDRLASEGYDAFAVDLPTVGKKEGPPATAYDDSNLVRSKVEALLDEGKNVILVANSYGGFVVTEAAKGLGKTDRDAAGKTGGALIHLIILGSVLTSLGSTFHDMVAAYAPTQPANPDDEYIDPFSAPGAAEMTGQLFFGSLPKDQQLYYGGMVKPHSVKAFSDPLTYAAYEHIPTTVVIGENDAALPPKFAHENVDKVIEKGVGTVKKISIPADHVMMTSHPEDIVKICLEAAK